MSIPDAPGIGSGFHQAQEYTAGRSPRDPWARSTGVSPTKATFYLVHLGVMRKRRVVEGVLTALAPDKPLDAEALDAVSGTASMGAVVLDWEGRIVVGQFSPAPFVFGVRRLREKKSLSNIAEEMDTSIAKSIGKRFGDPVVLEDPFKALQGALDVGPVGARADEVPAPAPAVDEESLTTVYAVPVTLADLHLISKSLLGVAGLPVDDLRLRVVTRVVNRKAGKPISVPDFKEDMLPSFYAKDIDRVLKRGVEKSGAALRAYLGAPIPPAQRVDILADTGAFAKALAPSALTRGRWPSDPGHSLNVAQQAAVGLVRQTSSGVVAVNGPPGTGKTTLLRDLVADMVLERAYRLVGLINPQDGMTKGTLTPQGEDSEPFEAALIDADLVEGTAIVVTSSNNAAVENVSLALPTLASIDVRAFPGAAYLQKAAQDLAATTAKGTHASTEVWGLAALRMGNKDNIRTVFRGLSRPFTKGGDEDVVKGGLVDSLTQKGPCGIAEWNEHCRTFLECVRRVDALLELREVHWSETRNLPVLEAMADACVPLDESIQAMLPWASRTPHQVAVVRAAFACAHPGNGLCWSNSLGFSFLTELRARMGRIRVTAGLLGLCWTVPDARFFAQDASAVHRASAWTDAALETARSELFLAAMALHEAFFRANLRSLYAYLTGLRKVLIGDARVSEEVLLKIWNGLFMLSPVVSTTLASIRRMPIAAGWIGLLLIDEAGQATPQSVLGALARARKAVVVGDPLQIEPVFNVPAPIVEQLMEEGSVAARFSPLTGSAQTVADGVMVQGAWIPRARVRAASEWGPDAEGLGEEPPLPADPLGLLGPASRRAARGASGCGVALAGEYGEGGDRQTRVRGQTFEDMKAWAPFAWPFAPQPLVRSAGVLGLSSMAFGQADRVWTGMPLRVHRRCQEPMFGIANAVSYGGQMVQGTPALDPSDQLSAFGPSAWFDVAGGAHVDKVRAGEMECLKACVARMASAPLSLNGRPLTSFIISPFVDVAEASAKTAADVLGWGRARALCPIGTVHSFQGKEADVVILVLGTAPGDAGQRARAWASAQANLLNVAITRARLRLYVIGSAEDWKAMPFFSELYKAMDEAGCVVPYPRVA